MGPPSAPQTLRAAGAHHAIYLGTGHNGPVFAPAEHCALVIGPPRSGKTTGIVVPNVLSAPGAVFVASTKPDILHATAWLRKERGPVLLFDPTGANEPPPGVERVGWSPLDAAFSWDQAVLTAEAMVGAARPAAASGESAHWNERAAALLACVLHAAALDDAGIGEVVSEVNRHDGARSATLLARHNSDLALDVFTGILETDGREQSGIWSTASGVLAAYRTRGALDSAGLQRIDPDALLREHATLYLATSSEHQHHGAPIVAGVLRTLRDAAYRRAREAARSPMSGERHVGAGDRSDGNDPSGARRAASQPKTTVLDVPLLVVLDELAGIAPLHDLPSLIAEGASQGVVTLACLQDLSQARARWGVAAEGFLTLFGTKVVLPGIGDTRTLEALSVLAGEHEIPQISTTRATGLVRRRGATRTVSSTRVRRLAPDAIANTPTGTALVYIGTRPGRVVLRTFDDEATRRVRRRNGRGESGRRLSR